MSAVVAVVDRSTDRQIVLAGRHCPFIFILHRFTDIYRF